MLSLKALREDMSHGPVPAAGGAGNPWCSLSCENGILIPASVFTLSSLCMYLHVSKSLSPCKNNSHWNLAHLNILWYHLNFTYLQSPTSK